MKIHGWNGHKVDCKLHEVRTTEDIYWSERSNSYVLAKPEGKADGWGSEQTWLTPNGQKCWLLSINGGGEVRWSVLSSGRIWDDEQRAAIKHFKLITG